MPYEVKDNFHADVEWYARGNLIRRKENQQSLNDADMESMIITRENEAHLLANDNANILM